MSRSNIIGGVFIIAFLIQNYFLFLHPIELAWFKDTTVQNSSDRLNKIDTPRIISLVNSATDSTSGLDNDSVLVCIQIPNVVENEKNKVDIKSQEQIRQSSPIKRIINDSAIKETLRKYGAPVAVSGVSFKLFKFSNKATEKDLYNEILTFGFNKKIAKSKSRSFFKSIKSKNFRGALLFIASSSAMYATEEVFLNIDFKYKIGIAVVMGLLLLLIFRFVS